ncbi:hypothetical protein GF420_12670 [candidate division GN15 bacterium]|nr:hypothetical protein [candidate division GN15 bacterium]
MTTYSVFELWIMAFVTLAIFSFLYKDNPVYRLVESIFAGLSAGYYVGLVWDTVILQQVVTPIETDGEWWLLLPAVLGFLLFSRLTRKYSWMSRVPLAFVIGATSGIYLTSQLQGLVLPQIRTTFLAQPVPGGSTDPGMMIALSSIVVIGVISTLIYFYFSHEHKGALGVTAKVGIWFIMISFGAHFGYTVMARVSLLIGRVQFLVEDWIGAMTGG